METAPVAALGFRSRSVSDSRNNVEEIQGNVKFLVF